MFSVGDKVVCVDDRFPKEVVLLYRRLPKKDETYTIRAVYLGRGKMINKEPGASDGEVGVLLQEVRNDDMPIKLNKNAEEDGFAGWRFRKLQDPLAEDETLEAVEEDELILV
jgi:hypothetical protein